NGQRIASGPDEQQVIDPRRVIALAEAAVFVILERDVRGTGDVHHSSRPPDLAREARDLDIVHQNAEEVEVLLAADRAPDVENVAAVGNVNRHPAGLLDGDRTRLQ